MAVMLLPLDRSGGRRHSDGEWSVEWGRGHGAPQDCGV